MKLADVAFGSKITTRGGRPFFHPMFANKPARLLVIAERASMCLSDHQLHGSLNSKRLNILLTSLISMTKFNQFDKLDNKLICLLTKLMPQVSQFWEDVSECWPSVGQKSPYTCALSTVQQRSIILGGQLAVP